jgi:hypothetical protein
MRSIVKIAGFVSVIVPLASQSAVSQNVAHSRACGQGHRSFISAVSAGDCSVFNGSRSPSRSGTIAWDQLASMPQGAGAYYPTVVNPEPIVISNPKQAQDAYGKGYQLYWDKRFDDALRYFTAAAASPESSCTYWYYKGCAEYYLGKGDDWKKSFEKGSKVQADRKESVHDILLAFVRLQEKPLRDELQGFIDRAESKGS